MRKKISTLLACGVISCCVVSIFGNEPNSTTKKTASSKTAIATPIPHCEVPCGIYADQRRFEEMLEDTETIAKSIKSINEYVEQMGSNPPTPTVLNQSVRWVTTKENHATNTQHIMAQYFLTQRVKADHKDYAKQLATAHKVMVSAMKCKQDSNPKTAEALRAAILDFYRAYEGKEPKLHKEGEAHDHDGAAHKK